MSVLCDGSVNGFATTGGSADSGSSGDFTLACWIKTSNTAVQGIASVRPTGNIYQFLTSDDTPNTAEMELAGGTGANAFAPTTCTDGAWHSLVVTRISGTITTYQDKVAGTTASSSTGISTSNSFTLGAQNPTGGGGVKFTGNIAKFAWYNSVGWTSGQVTTYHNSGGTTFVSSPQLQYLLASVGALTTDSSGNGHTLTAQGTGAGFTYSSDEPPSVSTANSNFFMFM